MSAFIQDRIDRPKPRRDDEAKLQAAIVQHLKLRAPKNVYWYAVPNGIPSSKRTGARFKAQGMRAGIADLGFVLADGRAAFMELKAKGGRLQPEQRVFMDWCIANAVPHALVADIDSALAALTEWGVLPPERVTPQGKEIGL